MELVVCSRQNLACRPWCICRSGASHSARCRNAGRNDGLPMCMAFIIKSFQQTLLEYGFSWSPLKSSRAFLLLQIIILMSIARIFLAWTRRHEFRSYESRVDENQWWERERFRGVSRCTCIAVCRSVTNFSTDSNRVKSLEAGSQGAFAHPNIFQCFRVPRWNSQIRALVLLNLSLNSCTSNMKQKLSTYVDCLSSLTNLAFRSSA